MDGSKTSTIPLDEHRTEPGALTYISDGALKQRVVVWLTQCTDVPLAEVAEFLGKKNEGPDDFILEGMRAHYPEIQLTNSVQMVEL